MKCSVYVIKVGSKFVEQDKFGKYIKVSKFNSDCIFTEKSEVESTQEYLKGIKGFEKATIKEGELSI